MTTDIISVRAFTPDPMGRDDTGKFDDCAGGPTMNPAIRLALTCLLLLCSLSANSAEAPTVLITGANRGLGFNFAQKYAARGWNVIATARNPDAATDLKNLASKTGRVRIEKLDVTDPASVNALGERLGGTPIDLLLNNAGMLGTEPEQQLGSIDPSRFDTYMRVNAFGALLVTERLLPNVRASRQKKVAGISAVVASFAAYPRIHRGLYYYKASKVALNMIMRNLALDTDADGITVIVLSPGVVNTYGVPMAEDMRGMVDIDTSVDGMMKVLDALDIKGTGKWDRYTGEVIGW
jgi:NAD(P)-dependent dehydrogenase (short-subunit alcohol dehydrogenase family)